MTSATTLRRGLLLAALALAALTWIDGARAGLLAFYSFDSPAVDSITADDSGNGYGGVVDWYAGPTHSPTGGSDGLGYYAFNGANYIYSSLNINPWGFGVLDLTSHVIAPHPRLTMGAWVRVATAPAAETVSAVISCDAPTNEGSFHRQLGVDFRANDSDTQARWNAWTGVTVQHATTDGMFSGTTPVAGTENQWVFLAAVYDATTLKASLYVNGQKFDTAHDAQRGYPGLMMIGANPLHSGDTPVGEKEYFVGDIDNVFFIDEALSETQIASIRTGGKAALLNWTGPVEPQRTERQRWDFDDGALSGFHVVAGTGTAFDNQPTYGDCPADRDAIWGPSFMDSDYYVATAENRPTSEAPAAKQVETKTGIIETDSFILGADAKITFRLGGSFRPWSPSHDPDAVFDGTFTPDVDNGNAREPECFNLERLVDDNGTPGDPSDDNWEMIRTAAAPKDPEIIDLVWDDLSEHAGDTVRLRIYDLCGEANWAHVSVDTIVYYASSVPEPIPGDTNNDRVVDAQDAARLASNWGATVTAGDFTQGDFNDDGVVNAADASILAAQWGDHRGTAEGIVPEPAVAMLLLTSMPLLLRRRRS